jgi:hypothetical protein
MNVRRHNPDVEFHSLAVLSFEDVSTNVSSDEKVAVFKQSSCPVKVTKHVAVVVLQIFAVSSSDDVSASVALELNTAVATSLS